MPDTIERQINLDEAQRIIEQHGGRVFFADTPQERLESKWQTWVHMAREIEGLLDQGVTLAPRSRPTIMENGEGIICRVAKRLRETTPVVVPEPEPEYVAEF